MKCIDTLVAQKTHLGWMLSGEYEASSKPRGGSQLLCVQNVPERVLRSLWELDAIGISDVSGTKDKVVDLFKSSISYGEGRYTVGLPWIPDKKVNLFSPSRRLAVNPGLQEAYSENLKEMEESGIIKEVNEELPLSGAVFYLPHSQ
ncbi:retrovirus-related pol polyprotein from transposon [Plakobranchus ocellatus]|uniref:Retrovirus-related pol polyprotein from transposon n=1 Tax=Plakobranchus ocellatus TaxID=259542 RepID=A0AAV4C9G4_9GAST|nr:retrovirus-related pol polyprotein from transposon [Plakobranchus ocellatus]